MVNHVLIIYDSISNKFTFSRKHHPSPNDNTTILNCISCGNFLGFDNETEIEITHEGVKSTKKINVITLKAINIKVQGDKNLINSTIDNFSTSKYEPNDIIFHKVIDTKSNNVLGYKNSVSFNNFKGFSVDRLGIVCHDRPPMRAAHELRSPGQHLRPARQCPATISSCRVRMGQGTSGGAAAVRGPSPQRICG
jgi:hypothetical protein